MLTNAYLLANIGADTAENEQHFAEILPSGQRGPGSGVGLRARAGLLRGAVRRWVYRRRDFEYTLFQTDLHNICSKILMFLKNILVQSENKKKTERKKRTDLFQLQYGRGRKSNRGGTQDV